MAALSSVSFAKQSHRALVLIADPGMEAAVSPHAAPSPAPQHFPPTEGRFLRGTQLLTLVQGHRETFNRFPLLVFQHLVQAIRDILGPEATIVYEVVSKEMGADSTVAAHMVLQDVGAYSHIVTPNQKPTVTHRMLCQAGPPTSSVTPRARAGCVINLRDPIVSHAWGCDTESLCRLVNVDNVLLATNPTTATALMEAFKMSFDAKRRLPESFYRKIESPSVRTLLVEMEPRPFTGKWRLPSRLAPL